MLHQRGKTVEEASIVYKFMYLNIYNRIFQLQSINNLLAYQNKLLKKTGKVSITIEGSIKREGKRPTLLRKAIAATYPAFEYTGFVDFGEYIFYCVLFTPELLQARNVQKIQSIATTGYGRNLLELSARFGKQISASYY